MFRKETKIKGQPSSSNIYRGTVSDSDSDSNKASSIPSEDSHHSHGTPSPTLEARNTVNLSLEIWSDDILPYSR